MGIAGWLVWCAGGCTREWTSVPRHATRTGEAGGFDLTRCETTVAEFVRFLNGTPNADFPETAQIHRCRDGRYAAREDTRRQAVAEVTATEAEAYARWRSQTDGGRIRLPTEAEWEAAARGGIDGAPYPWGWGGNLEKLAHFDAAGPAPRGGRYPANGFGLRDMAGNLYEWCAAEPDLPAGRRAARGGSWAERDPALLELERQQLFPENYRGRDVGFRVLRETGSSQ